MEDTEQYEKAKNKALQLINFRPRFSDELSAKLEQKQFSKQIIEKLINQFEQLRILDDQGLFPVYLNAWAVQKRWSARRIFQRLLQLNIPKEKASSWTEQYFADHSETADTALLELANKKNKLIKDTEPRVRRDKLARFLLGRGFNWSQVKPLLERIEKEHNGS